ncbi:MAG: UDP-N-acetylmuramoyl-L-alanine--D-glutamate ligase [Candidatus Sericytochromatia bacterium]|nr:UDP-N-acetylmuramoyl-L-alanine--D-glutamate ligase [Candidatus Sericytochromatia bacterium]
MDWNDKTVTILGLGRSGIACARELAAKGCHLILSDTRATAEIAPLVADIDATDIRIEGGGHSSACLDADVIVISPGVPIDLPIVQAALADGVPVLGEMELAYLLRPELPYIAITGTNGKTTTTTLVGALLESAGIQCLVGGNIGTPLISMLRDPAEMIVAEVSSFQLETVETFRPKVAAFLNFTDDHLNRHGTRETYWQAKTRIFNAQTSDDWVVLNMDDPHVATLSGTLNAREFNFSLERPLGRGVYIQNDWIVVGSELGVLPVMPVSEIQLRGQHNLQNVLAAIAIAGALALKVEPVRNAVGRFAGVEHRIEPVRTVAEVQWVNDSKGTNYASSCQAIASFSEPLVLIAGGRDKGGAIQDWVEAIRKKVRHVVLMGEAAPYFERVLRQADFPELTPVKTLEEAVARARQIALPGEVVLFSPACTSFDLYNNYEERGRAFKSLVDALEPNAPATAESFAEGGAS